MNRSAKITSIDTVQTLAAALHRFQYDASNALDDVSQQVTRAVDWIQNEQKDFWAHEARRSSERVAEAKLNLRRALTDRKVGDYTPSCREEKKLLEKAKLRLRVAEEKVEAVRRWSRLIDQAIFKYKGGVSLLARWLEADLPKALAALARMTVALETYVAVKAPAAAGGGDAVPTPSADDQDPSPQAAAAQEPGPPAQTSEPPAENDVDTTEEPER